MARPSEYPWGEIEQDYKAGVAKSEIRRRYNIPRNTLDTKISKNGWEVNQHAIKAMSGLQDVSVHFGALEAENPETAAAVYDRVRTETDFDIRAGRLVIKTMKKLEEVVDSGKKLEKLNMGDGVQGLQEVGMMGSDYKDVMDAAYRGKELLKGKDATGPQVAIQNNNTSNTIESYEVREIGK